MIEGRRELAIVCRGGENVLGRGTPKGEEIIDVRRRLRSVVPLKWHKYVPVAAKIEKEKPFEGQKICG